MGTVANTTPFVESSTTPTRSVGGRRTRIFTGKVTPSSSYATGGETIGGLPTGVGTLKAVFITPYHDGTRTWTWDNSTSTPKMKAFDAFATEEGAATDVSGTTFQVMLVYEQG